MYYVFKGGVDVPTGSFLGTQERRDRQGSPEQAVSRLTSKARGQNGVCGWENVGKAF